MIPVNHNLLGKFLPFCPLTCTNNLELSGPRRLLFGDCGTCPLDDADPLNEPALLPGPSLVSSSEFNKPCGSRGRGKFCVNQFNYENIPTKKTQWNMRHSPSGSDSTGVHRSGCCCSSFPSLRASYIRRLAATRHSNPRPADSTATSSTVSSPSSAVVAPVCCSSSPPCLSQYYCPANPPRSPGTRIHSRRPTTMIRNLNFVCLACVVHCRPRHLDSPAWDHCWPRYLVDASGRGSGASARDCKQR